ncbi:MAG: MFS transporter, partial [Tumebacillaceae bacterium]
MNRFWLFWFARTFSFYGDYIFSTTNIWFGLTQGGPMEVAYISATLVVFRALGSFLLAPIINYIGSRMMIVTSDLMRAALNVILWGAVFTDHSTLWLTLVINALSAFMAGGFESGMQAFIPTISAKLREANADLSRGRSVMQLLGYLTGGVLIQWFLGLGFLINAFTFIAAGIVSFYIGGGEPSVQAQTEKGGQGSAFRKYVGNWKLSWIAMQDSPTLRLAFWTALIINIMIIPMIALIAPLVSETSGGSGLMYSFVTSASVIGSLVGATWVRKSKIRDAYLILFGAMVCCLVGLVAGFSQIAIFLALTMLMYGLGQSIFNISESI